MKKSMWFDCLYIDNPYPFPEFFSDQLVEVLQVDESDSFNSIKEKIVKRRYRYENVVIGLDLVCRDAPNRNEYGGFQLWKLLRNHIYCKRWVFLSLEGENNVTSSSYLSLLNNNDSCEVISYINLIKSHYDNAV